MPSGYNILFVLVDQEHFFPKWPFPVPAREAIKKKAVTFLNHQAASCVCSSARSVVYTGQHIQHTGIADNLNYIWQRDLATSIKTVGHRSRSSWAITPPIQGKWHLSANLDLNGQGHRCAAAQVPRDHGVLRLQGLLRCRRPDRRHAGRLQLRRSTLASAITWLRTEAETLRTKGQPWYLAVNFVNPHDVMYYNSDLPTENIQSASHAMPIARAPDDELYRATWDNSPLPASRHQSFDSPGRPVAQKLYQQILDLQVGRWPDEDRRWRALRDYYFNAIRDCDRKVELLLDALRNNGMDKNTIVIFTADHGELGGTHQMRGKGTNAYRQQNHLPLMIHHPAFEGGTECKAITSQLDLTPTIIGLTGKDATARTRASEGLKGKIFDVAAQPGAGRTAVDQARLLSTSTCCPYQDPKWAAMTVDTRAYRAAKPEEQRWLRWRSTRRTSSTGWRSAASGTAAIASRATSLRSGSSTPGSLEELFAMNDVEVYDLHNDPGEMTNLALDRSETEISSSP